VNEIEPREDPIERIKREPIFYRGELWVTLPWVNQFHTCRGDKAGRNFRKHKQDLHEEAEYLEVEAREVPTNCVGTSTAPGKKIILLSEAGYLMLVGKCFRDPESWKIQRRLVTEYFRRSPSPIGDRIADGLRKGLEPLLQKLVEGQGETSGQVKEARKEIKAVDGKVQAVDGKVEAVRGEVIDLRSRVSELEGVRKPIAAFVKRIHLEFVHEVYHGFCPIDQKTRIVDAKGKLIRGVGEYDHYFRACQNRLDETWLISKEQHDLLTPGGPAAKEAVRAFFNVYHTRLHGFIDERGGIECFRPRRESKGKNKHPGTDSHLTRMRERDTGTGHIEGIA
jgi:hypothetical protein